MTTNIPLDELKQRLLAIGWTMDDGPLPLNTMFIHPPWGGLPYRLRDISEEDLVRWEAGEEDDLPSDDEPPSTL